MRMPRGGVMSGENFKERAVPHELRAAQLRQKDLACAYTLLGGYYGDKEGELPRTVYLDDKPPYRADDPSREIEAREAIARLLCAPEPLDQVLRQMLAALFHPKPDTSFGGARRIVLEHRKYKGSVGRLARVRMIVAREIYELVHEKKMSPTRAANQVAQKYKSLQRKRKRDVGEDELSGKTAMNYYQRVKHLVEWEEEQRKEFEQLQLRREKIQAQENEINDLRARIQQLQKLKSLNAHRKRPSSKK